MLFPKGLLPLINIIKTEDKKHGEQFRTGHAGSTA